ncbi:MAG TPA: NFACT RNA binding domain-containing protein [archaeon]|jgi:predicted ribosome quality control (RQC) complex YloA/Tae2 family protein|nr:NFACT RNA binding domain-containing protein [archaeon]HPC09903.1 NFACT RNA binding domain-containing protein [archaeon]HRT02654.1 NFACT RNA binding domain-containing protein [Candidatus Diapherotrites archaeon]
MEITIEYNISAGKNIEKKYQNRNKYKSKINGLEKAIQKTKQQLENLDKEISEKKQEKISEKKQEKKEWYHKFRWFFTSNGYLTIGGRDAKNNELLVKKYMEDSDLYFHADISGAAHVVLKNPEKKEIPEEDKQEAAHFAGIYSSAWKSGLYAVDVYSVLPEQVSKTPEPGEYVGKGAFIIRGKKTYYKKMELKMSFVYDEEKGIMACPFSYITHKNKTEAITLIPGNKTKTETAKYIQSFFLKKGIDISTDEIISLLPPGEFEIQK